MFSVLVALQLSHRRKLADTIESRYRRGEALLALYSALPDTGPLPAFREYMASPELLSEWVRLVLERRPKLVVELGSGVSTLLTARCLAQLGDGGRVLAFDHDAHFAEQTRQLIERAGLSRFVTVEHAALVPLQTDGMRIEWYDPERFAALPDAGVDLLLVDGPPGAGQRLARYPALPELRRKLAAHAVVVLDDARRPDEQEILMRWQRRFPELEASYLATEKGTGIFVLKGS
jgi:predicted O-methyltransferase YrrM